jgi:hypothetical protein
MPTAAANGIEIAYDEVGDARSPVILLIMGLGTQLIAWPDDFCRMLAQRAFAWCALTTATSAFRQSLRRPPQ